MAAVRRRLLTLLLLATAALAAGCGNDRTEPPDPGTVGPPLGFRDAEYPAAGIAFRAPGGWRVADGQAPLVATVITGRAQVAIWRYERTEELPEGEQELEAARDALVGAIADRAEDFEVQSTRIVRKEGLEGVEILGRGTIGGEPRRIRSLHAFAHGAEVVVDASAPPDEFERIDEETFGPLSRSLRLSAPA
jgi:hypothetical protein